ncbi:MAG: PASTA domain-containing protein [Bacteroidota bacterium]|nr:PASTA domain-containing protein [Bacteroidota bacterium]
MPKKKISFWRFLTTWVFWKNFLIATAIAFGLILVIQLSLKIYTDHGKEIQVPNFTGLNLQEVDHLCFQQELTWLIQDSIYMKDQPGGRVLDQYPTAGFRVKKNRKIFLTTNCWYPEMILMPKAFDMSYRQAKRLLDSQGFFIDSLEYEPYFARTYVLNQKYEGEIIDPGTPIEKGSGIILVLGQGLSNTRDYIPKLINMTRDSAASLSLDLHFNIGAVVFDDSIQSADDSINALVYRQFPDYHNKKAQLGSPIDIWLTLDSLKLFMADSSLFRLDTLQSDEIIPLN